MDGHDPGLGQAEAGGRLDVISLGPGDESQLTPECRRALAEADLLAGHKLYLELVPKELRASAELAPSGMGREVERVKAALDAALTGRKVGLVCSGDAGVYALGGLVLETVRAREVRIAYNRPADPGELTVRILPGLSAANAAASLLGAPLMNDFMVLSLSDLLTPWEVIERRARAAAEADLVTVLYNPRSKRRTDHLENIRRLMLDHRRPETPVGVVARAFREGQRIELTDLAGLERAGVDMQSVVIIGNSQTEAWQGLMYTRRGYQKKYDLS